MSDTTSLRRSVSSLEKQDVFDGYTKVVISVSDDVEYSAGTDTGRTMTLVCPWGTQAMAEKLLARVRGFQYQPFSASGAHLDPSVELGDGVTVGKVYSGVFSKDVSHGPLYTADISAPGGEKINYQYEYKSPQERNVERQYKDVRATLTIQADRITQEVNQRQSDTSTLRASIDIQADRITQEVSDRQSETNILRASIDIQTNRITQEVTDRQNQAAEFRATFDVQSKQISAKVSQTGGSYESFAWEILSDHSSFIASGKEVVRIDSSGAQISGIIRATGGKIGGLDIQSNYLSYNSQTWGGTNATGIYAGPNGIQCGSASNGVQITSNGNLYAENGYFRGNVNAGNIQYGGSSGYLSGSGLESHSVYGSQIGYNTISTAYTSGGINTSLGYADYANGVFNGWNTAEYCTCRALRNSGNTFSPMTIFYTDWQGNKKSVHVFGY